MRNEMIAPARKHGFGLIEVILGIAITLGLITGGLTLFNQTQLGSQTMDTSRTIIGLTSAINSHYRNSPDFYDLSVDRMAEAGYIEKSDVVQSNGSSYMKLPAGGKLQVMPLSSMEGMFQNGYTIIVLWGSSKEWEYGPQDVARNGQEICSRLTIPSSNTVENRTQTGPLGLNYWISARITAGDSDAEMTKYNCTEGIMHAHFLRGDSFGLSTAAQQHANGR